jgi:hypothetical protein
MTLISTRRAVATIVALSCIAIPASASAEPYGYHSTRSDAAQSGVDVKSTTIQPQTGRQVPAQTGGAPASTFPSVDFRGGDSPVDHPGASRSQPTPTTIEVVRPVRTVVRDVDQALPIALAGSALLLVLAMLAITLVRGQLMPRPGRSH